MSNVGEINVKIKADTSDYERGSDRVRDDLDRTDKKLKTSGQNFDGWGKKVIGAGKSAASSLKALPAIASAAALGFAAFAKSTSNSRIELESLARQAGETTAKFSAISFSVQQYNVDGEQFADISKDMADKLGEFAKVGSGPFQDYADVMGLTKEQAMGLAAELGKLSGRDGIQYLIDQMEAANVPASQMTFVLESMGNDLSKLVPLFSSGGSELKKLTEEFEKNVAVADSDSMKKFKDLGASMDIASASFKVFAAEALSPLTGYFTDAAKGAAEFFANLTRSSQESKQAAKDAKLLADAIGESSIKRTRGMRMVRQEEENEGIELVKLQQAQERLTRAIENDGIVRKNRHGVQREDVNLLKERLELVNAEIAALTAQSEKAQAVLAVQEQITAKKLEASGVATPDDSKDQSEFGGDYESRLQEWANYNNAAVQIEKNAEDQAKALRDKKLKGTSQMLSNLSSLMNSESRKQFEVGKAAAIGSAIVEAYAGISKTLGAYPYPYNLGMAAAHGIAAFAQVKNISKQKFGGASSAGAATFSGGQPSVRTEPQQQQSVNRNISVTLVGDNFGQGGIRGLISQINQELGDGVTLGAA